MASKIERFRLGEILTTSQRISRLLPALAVGLLGSCAASAQANAPGDPPASDNAASSSGEQASLSQGGFFSSIKQALKKDFDHEVVRGHFEQGTAPNLHRYYCLVDPKTGKRESNGVLGEPEVLANGMTSVKGSSVSMYTCVKAEQLGILVTDGYVTGLPPRAAARTPTASATQSPLPAPAAAAAPAAAPQVATPVPPPVPPPAAGSSPTGVPSSPDWAATPSVPMTALVKELTVPIHQFIDGFNSGNVQSAYAAYAPGEVTIVDEFAPHRWQGAHAPQAWAADYDKHAQATGVSDGVVKYGAPIRAEVDGGSAYVIIPTVYTYKEHGRLTAEEAQVTFVLQGAAGVWKIRSWTWSGVPPHPAK